MRVIVTNGVLGKQLLGASDKELCSFAEEMEKMLSEMNPRLTGINQFSQPLCSKDNSKKAAAVLIRENNKKKKVKKWIGIFMLKTFTGMFTGL
ncbi:hypothetical protein NPIL_625611 [Nephila pilipes]|uniref:Uncharacterized protein n=1 Tax=Nephila pilipes TaxID=299642 RepID=A0A8X6PQ88_NEPPI|nr:hypothetical protein NPIL_625611 [Nephila pilipes]